MDDVTHWGGKGALALKPFTSCGGGMCPTFGGPAAYLGVSWLPSGRTFSVGAVMSRSLATLLPARALLIRGRLLADCSFLALILLLDGLSLLCSAEASAPRAFAAAFAFLFSRLFSFPYYFM